MDATRDISLTNKFTSELDSFFYRDNKTIQNDNLFNCNRQLKKVNSASFKTY